MGLLTVSPAVIAEAQRRIRAQAASAGADPNSIIFGLPPPKSAPSQPPTAPPLPKLGDMVIPDSLISTETVDIAAPVVQTKTTDAPRVVYTSENFFPTYGQNERTNASDSGSGASQSGSQPRQESSEGWESREAWQQSRAVHLEKGGTEESFKREHEEELSEKVRAKAKRKRKPKSKAKTKRKRKPTAKRKPKAKRKTRKPSRR